LLVLGGEWDKLRGWKEFEEKLSRGDDGDIVGEWGEGMECYWGVGIGVSQVGFFEFGRESCDEE